MNKNPAGTHGLFYVIIICSSKRAMTTNELVLYNTHNVFPVKTYKLHMDGICVGHSAVSIASMASIQTVFFINFKIDTQTILTFYN